MEKVGQDAGPAQGFLHELKREALGLGTVATGVAVAYRVEEYVEGKNESSISVLPASNKTVNSTKFSKSTEPAPVGITVGSFTTEEQLITSTAEQVADFTAAEDGPVKME